MNVKMFASYLNLHRIFTRNGGRRGIGKALRFLTQMTYVGHHAFNTRIRNKLLCSRILPP